MSGEMVVLFQLIVLLFSVIVHEVSHGYVAERLGDPTARLSGRLTLNPLNHIDPVGSIMVPIILAISGAPVFGWAKPVPYNPNNLKDPIRGGAIIAAAGPGSNFLLALIFGLIIRGMNGAGLNSPVADLFQLIVFINIWIGLFNLIPVPPIDGSKILFSFLPRTQFGYSTMAFLERYGMILVFAIIFLGLTAILNPVAFAIFHLFTGL